MNLRILALGFPQGMEWIVILFVGVLLFGRRLPDIARSLGKSIVEFKRGIKDVREDIDTESRLDQPTTPRIEQQQTSVQSNSSKDQPTGVA